MIGSPNYGQDMLHGVLATTISRKSLVSQSAQPIRFFTVFHKLIHLGQLGNTLRSGDRPRIYPGIYLLMPKFMLYLTI